MSVLAEQPAATFSIGQAREIVKDYFEPNPWIYWTDFLASLFIAAGTFVGARWLWGVSPILSAVCFIVSCLCFYRVALFTHEMTHFRKGTFGAFRFAWNLLFGVPSLMPSFTYHTHVMHHMRKHYGTSHDGEYLPLGSGGAKLMLLYWIQPFIVPILAVFRFLVLSPLSWISPRIRRWVAEHASSMVIDPNFVRPLPSPEDVRIWRLQELGCFLVVVELVAFLCLGLISWTVVLSLYATAVAVLVLNHIRTMVAHRYAGHGEEMTHTEQLLDSLNFPKLPLLSVLWAPVGLRFHALHHLFPSMPYHNLAAAHRKLMSELPADSPYRQTESPGLWHSISDLLRRAAQSGRPSPTAVSSGA